MFKMNITNYKFSAKTQQGDTVEVPYDVRDSVAQVLLNPQQKLNGPGLLKANMLAEKVLTCNDPVFLLEDAEYDMLRKAAETTVGFDRPDVEFVRRIMEAERVTVQEVPSALGGKANGTNEGGVR